MLRSTPDAGRAGATAITGATGFVGQYTTQWLAARGHSVRAVPRVATAAAMRAAVLGADTVLHLAGRAHILEDSDHDPLAAYRAANVEATGRALEGAAAAGCRCFIFASSVKAMGERTTVPWTEDSPGVPSDPYGVSKLEAERLVTAEGSRLGIRTVILRLPLVYGPGMRANMLRLFDAVSRGVPLPFGAIRNRRSLLFVGNAAAAIAQVMQRPEAGSGLYLLSDGQDLSSAELVGAIGVALGRPARLLAIPPSLLRAAGRGGDLLTRVLPSPITSATIERLTDSLQVDSGRIRSELGFVPPYSVAEGMQETAVWYRSRLLGHP